MFIGPKLHMPPLPARMLPREHLLARLSTGKDRKLILVSGSAGSGKTSLVSQWITERALPVAWYSLEETDNEPDVFYRCFLAVLGTVDKDVASSMRPWIEGEKRVSGGDLLPHLLEALGCLKTDAYLVLDDFHLITAPEIHDFVARLLDRAPRLTHLVIVTRRVLPFSISRMKVHGQVAELSSEDLKLTHRETVQFFRDILPVKLSAGQIEELTVHMEGWMAGLQLFALSLKGKKTVDVLKSILNRASEEAADYLVDEVLLGQPDRMKKFLCATTLLSRFNADLCAEVTGMADAGEVLREAVRNNLFLVPLDDEGEWYRYHNLFSRAVRKRAGAFLDDPPARIFRAAAQWFAHRGFLEDAFGHAFASGDLEFAADILEDFLTVLFERYEMATFRRWLHKLPREFFAGRALLRLFDCRFKIESVQLVDVAATLDEIDENRSVVFGRYEGEKRKLCEDLLLVLKRLLPGWQDPENADIEDLENAFGQISESNRALSTFRTAVPFSYFYKGRMKAASSALDETSQAVFSSGSRSAIMIWYRVKAAVERCQGRLAGAEEVLDEAFRFFSRTGLSQPQPRFMLHSQMAWIHFLRNNMEKAEELALAVLRYVEQTRFLYEMLDVTQLLSTIAAARADDGKMERYTQKMTKAARDISTPGVMAFVEAHTARLAIASGDLSRAEGWAERRKLSLAEPFSLRLAFECLAWSELLSAKGRHRDALAALASLRPRCEEEGMMEAVAEIDALRAANLHSIKDRRGARAAMEQALRVAGPEGYVRPFVRNSRGIAPVLSDIAASRRRHHKDAAYVTPWLDELLKACGIDDSDGVSADGPSGSYRVAGLTPREAEILELVAAGFRDKEIAEKVFISLHTAKTHIKHILEKLEVTTRVQAVRRAEELSHRN
jgi:LuxR family maltose regulon positive regulatory protein